MAFCDAFELSGPLIRASSSSVSALGSSVSASPGAYSDGLLSVVDSSIDDAFLSAWSWLIKGRAIPLVLTGFGDVFFWSEDARSVYFLNVEHGTAEYVDDEIDWFLNDFLEKDQVRSRILRTSRFQELTRVLRPLGYLEVFVLEPWKALGGEDRLENYAVAKGTVYVDLVGQYFGRST